MKNLKNAELKLQQAAGERSLARRGVRIAAVLADALRTVGQDPVLVGGAAVEFYTEGGYATQDIDMLAPGGPALWKVMQELGFERRGKDFIHKKLEIYVEFPGDVLGEGKMADLLDVNGTSLNIISIEDLIVDRLCAYKFWKSEIDGLAVLLLLEARDADQKRLRVQAERENVADALDWLQKIYSETVRKKLGKKKASLKLRQWLQKTT